jgi:hypothetical protein
VLHLQIKKPPVYYAGTEPTARLFQHPYDSRILRETLKDKPGQNGEVARFEGTAEGAPENDVTRRKVDTDEKGISKTEQRGRNSKGDGMQNTSSKETVSNRGRNKDKTPRTERDVSPNKPQNGRHGQGLYPSRDESPSKSPNLDASRGKGDYGQINHASKAHVKNHKVEYSEEHKKRMKMNVFDRLMGGKK